MSITGPGRAVKERSLNPGPHTGRDARSRLRGQPLGVPPVAFRPKRQTPFRQRAMTPFAFRFPAKALAACTPRSRRRPGLHRPMQPKFKLCSNATPRHLPLGQLPTSEFFRSLVSWLVPLLNACLLFSSVIGVTEMAGALDGHRKHQRLIDQIRKLPPEDRSKAINLELGYVPDGAIDQYVRVSSLRIKNRLLRSWFEEPEDDVQNS